MKRLNKLVALLAVAALIMSMFCLPTFATDPTGNSFKIELGEVQDDTVTGTLTVESVEGFMVTLVKLDVGDGLEAVEDGIEAISWSVKDGEPDVPEEQPDVTHSFVNNNNGDFDGNVKTPAILIDTPCNDLTDGIFLYNKVVVEIVFHVANAAEATLAITNIQAAADDSNASIQSAGKSEDLISFGELVDENGAPIPDASESDAHICVADVNQWIPDCEGNHFNPCSFPGCQNHLNVTPCDDCDKTYADNEDGTHEVKCAVCGFVIDPAEDHVFDQNDDTECVCGAVKPATSTTYTFNFFDGSSTPVVVEAGDDLVKPDNTPKAVAADYSTTYYTWEVDPLDPLSFNEVVDHVVTPESIADAHPEWNFGVGAAIVVTEKIGLKLTVYSEDENRYPSYFIECSAQHYNNVYNLQPATSKIFTSTEEPYYQTTARKDFAFNEMTAYEMTQPITTTFYGVDENGDVVACFTRVDTIGDRAMKFAKKQTNGSVDQRLFLDIINYGAKAQAYFVKIGGPSSDLASAEVPTIDAGYEQYASSGKPTVNTVSDYDEKEGTLTSVFKNVQVGAANVLIYKVDVGSDYKPEDLTLTLEYTSSNANLGKTTKSANVAEMEVIGGNYCLSFDDITLYDFNQTVIATLTDSTGTMVAKVTYSVESDAERNIRKQTGNDDFWYALVNLGNSARAFFGYK